MTSIPTIPTKSKQWQGKFMIYGRPYISLGENLGIDELLSLAVYDNII
jgi:hypothetical protein